MGACVWVVRRVCRLKPSALRKGSWVGLHPAQGLMCSAFSFISPLACVPWPSCEQSFLNPKRSSPAKSG